MKLLDNSILDKYRVKFGKNIKFASILLSPINKDNSDEIDDDDVPRKNEIAENIFLEMIFTIFDSALWYLKYTFKTKNINYVNPLRAFLKRYYFLDTANVISSLNTIDGDNLTEILKENKNIQNKVNKWLEKFKLEVNVDELKDVIHKLKIKQHGLSLDITDVGFGISQVLPVIVQGFLSRNNSLTIFEQPEIHLHPKMQADLADIFIDVVQANENNEKILLIETHSEYLLKRLRRRMAEKKIDTDNVSIYFIHPKNNKSRSARIEEIEITNTGAFEWPKDFYSKDLEDTMEFLKNQ